MKNKLPKLILTTGLMLIVSCDDPVTVVSNYVHADGTITREIVMRSSQNKFEPVDLQVPFDTTWSIKDSLEINEKGDTTWVKRAEKHFGNAEEINLLYRLDSGANKGVARNVLFKRRFRWFNTEFRFSEKLDNKMKFGYPIRDFLNSEELRFFYSPDNIKLQQSLGADSLKFKILEDSVNLKTERWLTKSLVSEWIGEFSEILKENGEHGISMKSLKSNEDEILNMIEKYNGKFDSIWENGLLQKKFLGESIALKYMSEADSVIDLVTNRISLDFKDYSVRIIMPGKLTGTNGSIDNSSVLFWPVKAEFFMTEPYEMWAESKEPNLWAWLLTGVFLLFVFTGVIIRIIKKS